MKSSILLIVLLCSLQTKSFSQEEKALIIDDHVNIRDKPSLRSKVLFQLSRYTEVSILEISNNKETIDSAKAYCDFRNFIKIKTIDDKTGWVFGAYVYKIIHYDDNARKIYNKDSTYNIYTFFGEKYELYFINNNYNEEIDAPGAMYCRHPYIIVLERIKDKHIDFIISNFVQYHGFLCTDTGNFGSFLLDSLINNDKTFVLRYRCTALEGPDTFTDIKIEKDKNDKIIGY
jgi:hypothetical protein